MLKTAGWEDSLQRNHRGGDIDMHDESAPDSPRGPDVPVPVEDADEMRRRCHEEREDLTPHETADCAGAEYVERYENEEDGGT